MPASEVDTRTTVGLGLEVKFQSAVNLIRSLPKEGKYAQRSELLIDLLGTAHNKVLSVLSV